MNENREVQDTEKANEATNEDPQIKKRAPLSELFGKSPLMNLNLKRDKSPGRSGPEF